MLGACCPTCRRRDRSPRLATWEVHRVHDPTRPRPGDGCPRGTRPCPDSARGHQRDRHPSVPYRGLKALLGIEAEDRYIYDWPELGTALPDEAVLERLHSDVRPVLDAFPLNLACPTPPGRPWRILATARGHSKRHPVLHWTRYQENGRSHGPWLTRFRYQTSPSRQSQVSEALRSSGGVVAVGSTRIDPSSSSVRTGPSWVRTKVGPSQRCQPSRS